MTHPRLQNLKRLETTNAINQAANHATRNPTPITPKQTATIKNNLKGHNMPDLTMHHQPCEYCDHPTTTAICHTCENWLNPED